MSYFRDNIEAMDAYVPGEQPAGEAAGGVIKLNTNENPYPPSPKAVEVMRDLGADALRVYPDPMAARACGALAKVLGVRRDHILPGNGSDDLIMMVARACAGADRSVAYPTPTFTFYHTQALIENARIVAVPYDEAYHLPVDGLAEADAALTFVASPNSPSGTSAPKDQLERLAGRLGGVLVIDEAYVDFAGDTALGLIAGHDNVLVLRTMSKGYSLAGLRLAFGLAQPSLLAGLRKTKAIYTINAVAAAVGAAAIEDQAHKIANAQRVVASRARLSAGLEQMGFRVWPSEANFILARPPEGKAERIHLDLKARGILVRYWPQPPLTDKLRITVGTEEQNQALLDALTDMLA